MRSRFKRSPYSHGGRERHGCGNRPVGTSAKSVSRSSDPSEKSESCKRSPSAEASMTARRKANLAALAPTSPPGRPQLDVYRISLVFDPSQSTALAHQRCFTPDPGSREEPAWPVVGPSDSLSPGFGRGHRPPRRSFLGRGDRTASTVAARSGRRRRGSDRAARVRESAEKRGRPCLIERCGWRSGCPKVETGQDGLVTSRRGREKRGIGTQRTAHERQPKSPARRRPTGRDVLVHWVWNRP